jgi:hypothetical protein
VLRDPATQACPVTAIRPRDRAIPGTPVPSIDPAGIVHPVMREHESMSVGLGRTSLVVAASDGPGG